jgi:ribosomal protein S18 acetylase RimI-like enzyme
VGRFALRWLERRDEQGLARARAFADARFLDRVPLHASLEQPGLVERSRLLEISLAERLVALAAVVEDVFPYRSVPIEATVPGAATAALAKLERPFTVYGGESLWPELERAGGRVRSDEIQLARFEPGPLDDPDPAVERIEDLEELRSFYTVKLSEAHFAAGPFFGVRDEWGRLVSAGGVQIVTDRVAQLGAIATAEGRRRRGLARGVVTELLRALERRGRPIVLHVLSSNSAAIRLYGSLGFRGRRRIRLFAFDG